MIWESEKNEFLEPTYSLVHTNGYNDSKGKLAPWHEWEILEGEVRETFYFGPIVRTCSAMIRQSFLDEYYDLIKSCRSVIIGDWPLFAYYSTKGKFGYLTERMCVYRNNPTSISSSHQRDSFVKSIVR